MALALGLAAAVGSAPFGGTAKADGYKAHRSGHGGSRIVLSIQDNGVRVHSYGYAYRFPRPPVAARGHRFGHGFYGMHCPYYRQRHRHFHRPHVHRHFTHHPPPWRVQPRPHHPMYVPPMGGRHHHRRAGNYVVTY
ncbi:MAG: hypothetical protein ACE5Q3_14975 [Alphaproteobacteria bacterium]